ncbi:MAG: bifunctional diaminohydroxyphosphoribosylaminopyrimidine deaminase/5-amino-6-(5-phosphoribosylamino)uracil reductase RibD [Campylobacterales bacterium]|nr:bifunctional diaminohydroxyphosphoribosylaminopyrimidine deaminase/5-amino-6-(5-phosphoribosylamino)uracil reductase RibD [Campylobacterales bacterium]
MQLALQEAWKYQILTYPNPAVGAVVSCEGKIISVAAHKSSGTSHAEIVALIEAYEIMAKKNANFDTNDAQSVHTFLRRLPEGFFAKCTLYVTLEPCSHEGKTPSCAMLIKDLKLKRVCIATLDPIILHSGGAKMLEDAGIEIDIGIFEEKAKELLYPFEVWQKRAFVLFKLAQTSNAKITGGVISSQTSREHTHELRALCDKLLIGGATVRADEPILDSRLTQKNPPDVYIYTKNSDTISKDIPLFDVANREVNLGEDLSFLDKPSFVLVEGGEGMLKALKDKIDFILFYQAPNLRAKEHSYELDMDLKFMHFQRSGQDIAIWSKRV